MIKFFRKIRQQLAAENRLMAYSRYAIGEILLVVIGILIALQINNWNESVKEDKRETYLLKELQKEFVKDSIQLERYIFLTDLKAKEGRIVEDFLNGSKIHRDTVINNAFFNGRLIIFKSFTPTYDEIIATGQQHIIKNDALKELIKEYKDYLIDLDEFLLNECKMVKEKYNFHLYRYFDRGIMPELWKTVTRENRYVSIASLGNYRTDLEGYAKDPESLYFVTMNAGADSDLNRSYQNSIKPLLTSILSMLRELNKENLR